MDADRVRHTVAFALRRPAGSTADQGFLAAAEPLAAIPGVEAFELLAEVSPENGYRSGISMEFGDRDADEGSTAHPDHVHFVQTRWLPKVTDLLELDHTAR